MSPSGGVFGISYTGCTTYKERGFSENVTAIDLKLQGEEAEISAKLAESSVRSVQWPLFEVRETDGSTSTIDTLIIAATVAKTMRVSAKLTSRDNPGAEHTVTFEEMPTIQNGKVYLIQIMNKIEGLRGKIVDIDAEELHRQIRLARLYPQSRIELPPENETKLSEEQAKVYFIYEGTVFTIGGWLSEFSKKTQLKSSRHISYFENIGKEILKQSVKGIEDKNLTKLLELIKEGDQCQDQARVVELARECIKAQAQAMGFNGYAAFMRKILEAYAGDSALEHKDIIEELSTRFAGLCAASV